MLMPSGTYVVANLDYHRMPTASLISTHFSERVWVKKKRNDRGERGKLYYTQHILLSNVGQLPFFFFLETNTHIHKGEGKWF